MKKHITEWMWVITRSRIGFMVSLGDPCDPWSKCLRLFQTEADLRDWVVEHVGETVSPNHVIDNTGLGLVPSEWTKDFASLCHEGI